MKSNAFGVLLGTDGFLGMHRNTQFRHAAFVKTFPSPKLLFSAGAVRLAGQNAPCLKIPTRRSFTVWLFEGRWEGSYS